MKNRFDLRKQVLPFINDKKAFDIVKHDTRQYSTRQTDFSEIKNTFVQPKSIFYNSLLNGKVWSLLLYEVEI